MSEGRTTSMSTDEVVALLETFIAKVQDNLSMQIKELKQDFTVKIDKVIEREDNRVSRINLLERDMIVQNNNCKNHQSNIAQSIKNIEDKNIEAYRSLEQRVHSLENKPQETVKNWQSNISLIISIATLIGIIIAVFKAVGK